MFRIIAYLFLTIFLITLIRNVLGLILRVFSSALQTHSAAGPAQTSAQAIPLSGELKKDPVCGTYTSAATALQKTVGGQTFYFCSPQCRDRFRQTA